MNLKRELVTDIPLYLNNERKLKMPPQIKSYCATFTLLWFYNLYKKESNFFTSTTAAIKS